MDVFIGNNKIKLLPNKAIGKGGEADIYDIGGGKAVKLFKQPSHPDLAGLPAEQKAAEQRIKEHQKKLPAFPKNIPARVVAPIDLVKDKNGDIVGYSMEFLANADLLMQYSDRTFRDAGVDNAQTIRVFDDLRSTINDVHKCGIVIGDFNDLNVLVKNSHAYMIDADSWQFANFLSKVFTAKFVDPLRCDPLGSSPMLFKPHNADSDWYAFNVMLIQSLLFAGPYDGIFKPKDPAKRIMHDARPLHRITIFNPEVRYPKPAVPFISLSDDLLQHFHLTFEKDKRGEFPASLLQSLVWSECTKCGLIHARTMCPACFKMAPALIKTTVQVRGNVKATTLFTTRGVILHSTVNNGELKYLFHENGEYRREGGGFVIDRPLDPKTRYRISGSKTYLGRTGEVIEFEPGREMRRINVDCVGQLPIFDANEKGLYWVSGEFLNRDAIGPLGDSEVVRIGSVLQGQTMIWVGKKFGFGFYRAGQYKVSFTFNAESKGINDQIQLPPIVGQLLDSTCYFSDTHCWFLTTTKEGAKIINRCVVFTQQGEILAMTSEESGGNGWLGTIRGKFAFHNHLFASTDSGIKRIESPEKAGATVTTLQMKEYPDTEPFVDAATSLLLTKQGLIAVSSREITLLQIS